MHKIYIGKRCITICKPEDQIPDGSTVFVPSADPDGTYAEFCAGFREVNAAGGLVRNGAGECLLINRSGLWDLPKGHQEDGEDISVTAIREVMEETGLSHLHPGRLICVTDHCYLRDGIWHLKHTWWYDMLFTGDESPVPQTEEGITSAVWAGGDKLRELLGNTYPSILEVFKNT